MMGRWVTRGCPIYNPFLYNPFYTDYLEYDRTVDDYFLDSDCDYVYAYDDEALSNLVGY